MDTNNVTKITWVILLFFIVIKSHSQYATIVNVGGINNAAVKNRIEENTGKLLTELNIAFSKGTVPVLSGIEMTADARGAVLAIWETSPFRCRKTEIMDDLLMLIAGGMELRNIPLFMKEADSLDKNQEGVFVYTKKGEIDNLYLAIEKSQWLKVMHEGDSLKDLKRRQIILDFVENFRTSYNRKDISMLEKVFSEDALIITGKVVKVTNSDVSSGIINPKEVIIYTRQSREEYLSGMRRVFAVNSYLNIKFEEIEIVQHKKRTDYYGVTIKQYWNSARYSDVGYVFLLIDFRDEKNPIIHVRTWQPAFKNGFALPEEEKIGLEGVIGR